MSTQEQSPTIGRIVHYVLEDQPSAGEERAAMIVRIWGPPETNPAVNLLVFADGANDYVGATRTGEQEDHQHYLGGSVLIWKTSRMRSDEKAPGTWHWPERT